MVTLDQNQFGVIQGVVNEEWAMQKCKWDEDNEWDVFLRTKRSALGTMHPLHFFCMDQPKLHPIFSNIPVSSQPFVLDSYLPSPKFGREIYTQHIFMPSSNIYSIFCWG